MNLEEEEITEGSRLTHCPREKKKDFKGGWLPVFLVVKESRLRLHLTPRNSELLFSPVVLQLTVRPWGKMSGGCGETNDVN